MSWKSSYNANTNEDIADLQAQVSINTNNITTLNANVTTNATDIETLQNDIIAIDSSIDTINDTINVLGSSQLFSVGDWNLTTIANGFDVPDNGTWNALMPGDSIGSQPSITVGRTGLYDIIFSATFAYAESGAVNQQVVSVAIDLVVNNISRTVVWSSSANSSSTKNQIETGTDGVVFGVSMPIAFNAVLNSGDVIKLNIYLNFGGGGTKRVFTPLNPPVTSGNQNALSKTTINTSGAGLLLRYVGV